MQTATSKIPLSSLISILRKEGFDIGTSAMLDMQRLLANVDDEGIVDAVELKYLLAPIICRNKEEQAKFYKNFDEYIDSLDEQCVTSFEAEATAHQRRTRPWLRFLLAIMVLLVGFAVWWIIFREKKDKEDLAKPVIVDYSASSTYIKGDTIKLKVESTDTLNKTPYETNWKIIDPQNMPKDYKSSGLFSFVADSAGLYTVVASVDDPVSSEIISDTALVDVLCEAPPTVSIDEQVSAGTRLFTAIITNADTAILYRYHWTVNGKPRNGDQVLALDNLRNDQGYTVSLMVDWQGKGHCSVDSLTYDLGVKPVVEVLIAGARPLELKTDFNWKNALLSFFLLIALPIGVMFYSNRSLKRERLKKKLKEQQAQSEVEDDAEQKFTGPFTIEFSRQEDKIMPEAGISQLAEVLRKRQVSDVMQLNVLRTINSTIYKGGFPVLEYTARTEPTDFLILIDKEFPDGHLAKLFAFVADRLKKEQVNLTVYTYSKEPLLFSNEGLNHTLLPLDKLSRLYPQSMLIIFTNADGFFKAYEPALKKWIVDKFRHWATRMIITPVAKTDWGLRELNLYNAGFTVVPADINAHHIISNEINHMIDRQLLKKQIVPNSYSSKQFNFSRWRQVSAYLKNAVEENRRVLLMETDLHLMEQWVCSLAIYPHINWEVTIAVGKAFEEKYSKPGHLLNFTNLLVLSRIQWMNDGQLTDSLKVEMINRLEQDKQLLARSVLVELLKEVDLKTHENSLIKNELNYLNITNKVLASASGELTAEEIEDFKKLVKTGQVDYILEQHLNESGRSTFRDPQTGKDISLNEYEKILTDKDSRSARRERLIEFLVTIVTGLIFFGFGLNHVLKNDNFNFSRPQEFTDIVFTRNTDSLSNVIIPDSLKVMIGDKTYDGISSGNGNFTINKIPVKDSSLKPIVQLFVKGESYDLDFKLDNRVYKYTASYISSGELPAITIVYNNPEAMSKVEQVIQSLQSNGYRVSRALRSFNDSSHIEFYLLAQSGAANRLRQSLQRDSIILPVQEKFRPDSFLEKGLVIYIADPVAPGFDFPPGLNEMWWVPGDYATAAFYTKQKKYYASSSGSPSIGSLDIVESKMIADKTYRIILKGGYDFYVLYVRNVSTSKMDWQECPGTYSDLNAARNAPMNCGGGFDNANPFYVKAIGLSDTSTKFKINLPLNGTALFNTEEEKFRIAKQKYDYLDEGSQTATTVLIEVNRFSKTASEIRQRATLISNSRWVKAFPRANIKSKEFKGDAFERDHVEINFTSTTSGSGVDYQALLQTVISRANSQLGVKEEPPGSDKGYDVEKYLSSVGLQGGNGWAAAFVYWCYNSTGNNPLKRSGSAMSIWEALPQQFRMSYDEALKDPSAIKPGNLFFIQYNTQAVQVHTGIVINVKGDLIETIEGNMSTTGSDEGYEVVKKERKISDINLGFTNFKNPAGGR